MTTHTYNPLRLFAGAGIAALSIIASQSSVFAHITLATGETRANTYYKAVLQVPHGCDGQATQSIRVQIPEGVISVKPMPKPGWTLNITRGAYAKTYQSHGKSMTEGPKEIVWSGGSLSDDNYDEFVFTSFISGDFSAGQTVYFPTVQKCASGEMNWADIPAAGQSPHALKTPAPGVRIATETTTMAQMDHGNMDHMHMNMAAPAAAGGDTFKVGDLVVTSPWTRATPGGAKIAGGYLKITNNGKTDDRLVKATASISDRVEVHEMSMNDGVMKMRALPEGLTIRPGETVELKPGGFHMMFMDIKQPLKQGDTMKATLTFEKAGSVEVSFNVGSIGASSEPAHKH